MSIDGNSRVGRVAAEHPLATRIFARHGIDFCCGGGRPLQEVCDARGLDVESILHEIQAELSEDDGHSMRWDRAELLPSGQSMGGRLTPATAPRKLLRLAALNTG